MLLGLLAMGVIAGIDAWNDPTPRKPFEWRKRTRRERNRVAVTEVKLP